MKLTSVLYVVPRFHFWKDFGAGKRRKIVCFRLWRDTWRYKIAREKVENYTLKPEQLPAGSRIIEAEDFMLGHPDLMPDEIIRYKTEKTCYDHPWPFNINVDPKSQQTPHHFYQIGNRFFVPRDDALTLTNTVLIDDKFEAQSPLEPTEEHVELAQRAVDWSIRGDSTLTRLPKRREFPKINIKPRASYGITKERSEIHVLNSLMDLSQTILSQHHHNLNEETRLKNLLARRNLGHPQCLAPFERGQEKMILELNIDSMSVAPEPLEAIEKNPRITKELEPIDIRPRSWRSLLEKSRNYDSNWTFALPTNTYLHTIQLTSYIKRDHKDSNEMLARSLIHAFGLTSQFARIRHKSSISNSNDEMNNEKSQTVVLEDPLQDQTVVEIDRMELLPEPVVLQVISFDLTMKQFHFLRYQLNTINFDDLNETRIKNQAWYSGPISMDNLKEVLRYYLDFQVGSSSKTKKVATDHHQDHQPHVVASNVAI